MENKKSEIREEEMKLSEFNSWCLFKIAQALENIEVKIR